MTFKEIIACTGGTTCYCGEDFSLSAVKFDSREDMKGVAFIAFHTHKNNGHRYVSVAVNKGALAVIASEDIKTTVPVIKVADTQKAYRDISGFYRNKFSSPVIALTGSNGKTTVKNMLFAVLSVKYKVLATEKNLNNEIGVPQTLLKLDENYDAAVIEMGMNHRGEISTLSRIVKPDIAIITNVGTAHMGNLGGSRTDVLNAKMEITEGLALNGTLILCGDDDLLSDVNSDKYEIVFCGLNADNRNILYVSGINQFWDESGYGLTFEVHYQGGSYSCTLPVIGRHNAVNALFALTAGIKLGVSIEDGIEALRNYSRSSMRLETSIIQGIKFIKDYYNASLESTKAALDTLAQIKTDGLRIAILEDLLEQGGQSKKMQREIAEYTTGKADKVYYWGSHCSEFLSGRADSYCFGTKSELRYELSEAVSKGDFSAGDIILIKGSIETGMWEQYEFIRRLLERGSSIVPQTQLLIDVDALKYNYSAIKNYVGKNVQVLPVIKADAYGTGANLLANIYSDCDFFAIADLLEAEELHSIMPNAKFLVLYQPFDSEIDRIAEREHIVTSVCTVDFVRKLNTAAKKAGKRLAVHIEIDTGMSRLGVLLKDCEKFAKAISECENLIAEGIYTHYSSADMYGEEDLAYTRMQTEKFKEAIRITEAIIGQIKYKHACASAAIFNPQAELFNMVRPGYILRGYYPCEEIKEKIGLRPALKYVTRVTQAEEYEKGSSVSYGRTFEAARKIRLAKVPVGYDDGLMRRLSNKGAFVINGQLAPIVGNITMDYTMVDITDINPEVKEGDEVAVFDNVNMTIERMAELCGTIGYEIITNIKNKADRIERFW